MAESYVLQDVERARGFLESLPRATLQRAEPYVSEGRVHEVRCLAPGRRYTAVVVGDFAYTVQLFHEQETGWDATCTCPLKYDCKHVAAAFKSLLVKHAGAEEGARTPGGSGPNGAPAPAAPVTLAEKARAALGRPLAPNEVHFLRRLTELHARCRQTRSISSWEIGQLGLRSHFLPYGPLRLWPEFPNDEHTFWLYLAHYLRANKALLPEFLIPVTDLSLIAEPLQRLKRNEEIERWTDLFGRVSDSPGAPPAHKEASVCDVRLRVQEGFAAAELRRPGSDAWETLKLTQCRRFAEELEAGDAHLVAEAEWVWQPIATQMADCAHSNRLNFHDEESRKALSRLFRLPQAESRLVNAAGQPFVRSPEPLRWQLTPAARPEDDYRVALVHPDGRPAPPVLCALPGLPTLYVTADTVFPGPPCLPEVMDLHQETVIPAPALETRGGLEFLTALGVEPPPRLRDRVRTVPLRVLIQCELHATYPGSATEHCQFKVLAESDDGVRQESWNGEAWVEMPSAKRGRKAKRRPDEIVVYDRALPDQAARRLAPLELKTDAYTGIPNLRVTKKFPELFVAWLRTLPPDIPVQLKGELATLTQGAVVGNVRLDVSEAEIDWFDLRVVINVTDTTLSPEEIKLLLNAKGGYVRLAEKGWRRLAFDLSEEEDERLARIGLNPRDLSAEPQRLHALQLADDAARRFLPAAQAEQIQRRASELKARVTPDVPATVTAALRPYQCAGFQFLAYLSTNRFGGILADDMGLGKTLQALVWLVWLRADHGAALAPGQPLAPPSSEAGGTAPLPSLVVCPKSVMDNWHAEVARFTPGLRARMWPANELDTLADRLGEADLHVLNYSQLRMVGEGLAHVNWLAVILDEGQYIKNPNSQTAQVARALRARHRLVLTGTPIENRLLDLWSLMAFAMPGVLGSRHQFAKLYDAKEDPFARRRLSARVRPFLLRRTKAQVAKDLPDRVEEDLFCEIEGEQKALYRAELKRAQQLLLRVQTQQHLAELRFHFLTSLLRLRQICCHPALVKPDSKAASAKLEALLEQLEPLMEEGHKVLVFSQFVELLALLKPPIADRGWRMFYLAGETENRGDLVREFQSAEGAAVFLISLKAGGFGLNLTAASYVVLFDPWWNPAVENQAIDRTHRIGQTRKVIAYRLLIKESVEEKIRSLQKQKKALVEDVLGEEKFSQSLTLNDLQFLLAD